MWDEADQCPHLFPLPEREEDTGGRVSWESGREIVGEAPGEGFPSNEANRTGPFNIEHPTQRLGLAIRR
jgi:hypothetical protein